MNEFKSLSNEKVQELYFNAVEATYKICPLISTNDRLYLEQRKSKLRQEWLKRTLGH